MTKFLLSVLLAATVLNANAKEPAPTFTQTEFDQLKFLEGRWKGTDPKGSAFYEQYDFPAPGTLRSRRFATKEFAQSTDSSTVTIKDSQIVSRWGDFSWRASEISRDKACFEPINAPSSFCWSLSNESLLQVTQRWKDADGKAQSMTMELTRIK